MCAIGQAVGPTDSVPSPLALKSELSDQLCPGKAQCKFRHRRRIN